MSTALLVSAFLLGIGGSMHCLGMCGPLVLAVPFPAANAGRKGLATAIYYLAKCLAYGSMGILMGLLGKGISLVNWQQGLSIAAGILILLMAFVPAITRRLKGHFLFRKEFGDLFARIQARPRLHYYFVMGYLNGFLPCGLVFTALAASTVTAAPLAGFLFMFLFGLGTTPALAILSLFKTRIGFRFQPKLRKAALLVSVFLGLLLILRGLDLGIPYLSPAAATDGTVKNCCSKPAV